MYERNAIVLERYFDKILGYNMKCNIKTNFFEYKEMVECLEKYKDVSEDEESIMQEYDLTANKIREIQRIQENLYKKNNKLQIERNEIFQNIDDNASVIQKKMENINDALDAVNREICENANSFIDIVREFSEKTETRQTCGKSRRNIENDYNTKLNKILDDYQEIDLEYERKAKQFIELDTGKIETELKDKIIKNGENEKIPFNDEVITKAICLGVDIQKREAEILANIYEKTNRLFTEIKNNNVKLSKHKKSIKDANSKMLFISAIKEYLFQFLDNERLTAVNGEEEHAKLMSDACKNLDEDLIQINNLYTLLLKEISKKITKKSYPELYKREYLEELERKAEEFDKQIKKLNLTVTIINPNYWRIEGMKKIYTTFDKCVTEEYGRDLSEFLNEPKEDDEIEEDYEDVVNENEEEINEEKLESEKKDEEKDSNDQSTKDSVKAELDRKIDMILGFDNSILKKGKNLQEEDDDDDFEDEIEDDKFGFRWDGINDDEEDEEDDDDNIIDEEDDDEEDSIIDEEDDDDSIIEEEDDDDSIIEEDEDNIIEKEDDDEIEEDEIGEDQEDIEYTELKDDEQEDNNYEFKQENLKKSIEKTSNNEDIEEINDTEDDWEKSNIKLEWNDEDEFEKEKTSKNEKIEEEGNENKEKEESWEDEFVKIDKKSKDKKKKKRGFFDKFKK